ncbi:hypothetical protein [Ectopseudomonas mendocina]|nr:hypothetical protein [Pseudomonas mendocina]
MPADVLYECRQQALEREQAQSPRPVSRLAGVVIILIWLALAAVLGYVLLVHYGR